MGEGVSEGARYVHVLQLLHDCVARCGVTVRSFTLSVLRNVVCVVCQCGVWPAPAGPVGPVVLAVRAVWPGCGGVAVTHPELF